MRLCVALLVAGTAPRAVSAQAVTDTARAPDLVVTATRLPAPASAVPAATTVLQGDDLRARGVVQLLDALREVPGITVVQTGSYGAVASVFMRGGESDYVKVLLDGVPLNLPGGGVDFANLTTADLDRIEVVRGPASVLYGADAMSGVIQLFTRRASERGSVEISGDGGTFGSSDFTSHVDLNSTRWAWSATGTRQASDGTYAFNSGYRNAVGSTRIAFDGGDAGSAALDLRYGDGITHFPTDGSGNAVDHNQFTEERNVAASLHAARAVARRSSLHLLGYAMRERDGYTNRSDTPADTTGFDFIEDRGVIAWRRGGDLRFDWHARPDATLSAGIGAERETDDEHDVGVSNFGDGASTDTTALAGARTTRDGYVQLLAAPVRPVSLQLGARVDDNSAFGTFGTWRGGVSWQIVPGGRVWASAGTAFKAPTFSQLTAHSAYETGNPDLAPERSTNAEIGAETWTSDECWRVGITGFWQRFRDLIQYVNAPPGDPTYTNLGGANSRGLEATVFWRATHRFTLSAQGTWLHTEVTDTGVASSLSDEAGQSLIRRPAFAASATLEYRWHGVTGAATLVRNGARDDVDYSGDVPARVILPGYSTVAAAFDVPLRRAVGRAPGVDITLRGENLFDAAYQQVVGFPGRRRTLLAGARLVF